MSTLRGLALVVLLCLGLTNTSTFARAANDFVDEQWPTPDTWQDGHYHTLIADTTDLYAWFSRLEAYPGEEKLLCDSAITGECAQQDWLPYTAVLPPCLSAAQTNCIADLSAIHDDGTTDAAKFSFYTVPDHPNLYRGNAELKLPEPASVGVWTFANTVHAAGSMFALGVSLGGVVDRKAPRGPSSISVIFSPVSRYIGTGDFADAWGMVNYPKCLPLVNPTTGLRTFLCSMRVSEWGKYVCSFKLGTNGDCLLRRPFPSGVRFRLSIRLADRPSGWLHGRLTDPQFGISDNPNGGVLLSVTAGPASVPIFYAGGFYSELPQNLQDFYAKCLGDGSCRVGSRQPRHFDAPLPLAQRNVSDEPAPFQDWARVSMAQWMQYANDSAVAVPSTWTFRTLTLSSGSKQNACLSIDSSGVKGVVTTNATAYSDGPPTFKNGQLTYTVMAPHYRPDGTTPFLGRYNLLLRSDVARCLYGFSNAPLQAKIEVVDASGSQNVAVTTMAESNGWLSLAASGFTFSSPTINVQLSQEQPQVAKPTTPKPTITCVNTKSKKVTKVAGSRCPAGTKKR